MIIEEEMKKKDYNIPFVLASYSTRPATLLLLLDSVLSSPSSSPSTVQPLYCQQVAVDVAVVVVAEAVKSHPLIVDVTVEHEVLADPVLPPKVVIA